MFLIYFIHVREILNNGFMDVKNHFYNKRNKAENGKIPNRC